MKSQPLLSVVIVSWQEPHRLPECLACLSASATVPLEIVVVNNGLPEALPELHSHGNNIRIIQNRENVGYSAANNQGIHSTRGEFVLFLNPDAYVETSCIPELIGALQADRQLGFVHGKLLRHGRPNVLDGAGIAVSRGRKFWDRGSGQPDRGQFDRGGASFAGCGALLMFRRAALKDVRFDDEYFDEDFFAYKEDIDLCWRAWWRGWRGRYVPSAVAAHARGHDLPQVDAGIVRGLRDRWAALKARRHDEHFRKIRVMSLRNQCWLQLKNEPASWIWKDLPWHATHWATVIAYAAVCEPYMLRGFVEATRKWSRMRSKRRAIQSGRRLEPRELHELIEHAGFIERGEAR